MVYGGTGAPPLLSKPGHSEPQYYSSYTRPYVNAQNPYLGQYAPTGWRSYSHHRRSPSPPPLVPPQWDTAPEVHKHIRSEPLPSRQPRTAYVPSQTPYIPTLQRPPITTYSPYSSRPLSRPKTSSNDSEDLDNFISKWAVGDHYGPVLSPFIASIVRPEFSFNPMLHRPPADGENNTAMTWNMLYPGSYSRLPLDPSGESWFERRVEPATFPKMNSIRIISRTFPWMIEVKAEDVETAVTCRDIVDQLSKYFCVLLGPIEMDDVSAEHRKAMSAAFRVNRSQEIPAEIFRNSIGMRRIDWLCKNTMFEGLEEDKGYVTERLSVFVPGTFVMRCGASVSLKTPMTQRRQLNKNIGEATAALPDAR